MARAGVLMAGGNLPTPWQFRVQGTDRIMGVQLCMPPSRLEGLGLTMWGLSFTGLYGLPSFRVRNLKIIIQESWFREMQTSVPTANESSASQVSTKS